MQEFEKATGVAPVPGGGHPRFGTRNYLVSSGGAAYLVIIGADPESTTFSGTRSFGVDDVRETGVVTWAVHPGDLDDARARQAGLDPSPAVSTQARVRVTALVATHPRPEEITPVLRAIGTDLEVGRGEPRLRLTVEGPGGSLTL